jgi:hypothetical protein
MNTATHSGNLQKLHPAGPAKIKDLGRKRPKTRGKITPRKLKSVSRHGTE